MNPNEINQKCELCSMESTHSERDMKGAIHFFCGHHSLQSVPKKKESEYEKLLPLLYIFVGIALLASIRQFVVVVNLWQFMMDFMGTFFVVFGGFKLIDLKGFVNGFESYDFITKRFRFYGYAYPFIEIFLGVLYLMGYMFLWQNILVLILSLIGIYTAYKAINHEDDIRCVCLGTLFDLPMTWVTLSENLLMFIMVIFMIVM